MSDSRRQALGGCPPRIAVHIAACLLGLSLSLLPTAPAASDEDVLGAAARLKQAHVEGFWAACQQHGASEASCRAKLQALHARELQALARIAEHLDDSNADALNRAFTDCYSPANTYSELITCWEELANHLGEGDVAEGPRPRLVKSESSWDEVVSQIAALDPLERRSLVLCVRGSVTVNFDKTVKPNLSKGASDALWAVKIYSRASAKQAQLAAKAGWPEMEQYFKREALDAAALIRGEIEQAEYQRRAKANESVLARALTPERARMREHETIMRKHQALCERAATLVIADAKVFASER